MISEKSSFSYFSKNNKSVHIFQFVCLFCLLTELLAPVKTTIGLFQKKLIIDVTLFLCYYSVPGLVIVISGGYWIWVIVVPERISVVEDWGGYWSEEGVIQRHWSRGRT